MPRARGDALGSSAVVAGEHDRLDAEFLQGCDRFRCGLARGVGDRDQAGGTPVDRDVHDGPALAGHLFRDSANAVKRVRTSCEHKHNQVRPHAGHVLSSGSCGLRGFPAFADPRKPAVPSPEPEW